MMPHHQHSDAPARLRVPRRLSQPAKRVLTMNDLIVSQNSNLSMTSREIAEITGKQHKHVLRDIDAILETLSPELGLGFKSSTYKDSSGKENRQFELDRDSAYCVVAGYDANARMKIIKRWQELEAAATNGAMVLSAEERRIYAMIDRLTQGVSSRIDSVEATMQEGFNRIDSRFDDMESRLVRRASFSAYARRLYALVSHRRYAGRCPCCQETQILGPHGQPLPDVIRFDHWNGKQHNMINNGWPVCVECNRDLERNRHQRHLAFQLFHQHLDNIQAAGEQLVLPFDQRLIGAAA